jgi:hypothetical protein
VKLVGYFFAVPKFLPEFSVFPGKIPPKDTHQVALVREMLSFVESELLI